MARAGTSLIDRLAHQRSLKRWARIADFTEDLDLDELRSVRTRAKQLQRQINTVLTDAEERLTLPLIGSNAIRAHVHADWSWRPALWRGRATPHGMASVEAGVSFGDNVKIFHDCPRAENALRQMRNTRETDLAPFGLRIDVFRFAGSFLSVVVDFPVEALRGLNRRHLLRVEPLIEVERELEVFARLNLRHGPNIERLVREIDPFDQDRGVDFDLAYSKLNEQRISGVWVELIFENPGNNELTIRDLTLSRRPRAEL